MRQFIAVWIFKRLSWEEEDKGGNFNMETILLTVTNLCHNDALLQMAMDKEIWEISSLFRRHLDM